MRSKDEALSIVSELCELNVVLNHFEIVSCGDKPSFIRCEVNTGERMDMNKIINEIVQDVPNMFVDELDYSLKIFYADVLEEKNNMLLKSRLKEILDGGY